MYRKITCTPLNVLLLDGLDDLCCSRTDRFRPQSVDYLLAFDPDGSVDPRAAQFYHEDVLAYGRSHVPISTVSLCHLLSDLFLPASGYGYA